MYSIDKDTITAKAREKNQHRFGILRIYGGKNYSYLTKLKK
jgi:hypothetical protein